MLSFNTPNDLKSKLLEIETNNTIHINSFISSYENLSDDELDLKSEEVAFNDQQTYSDFEDLLEFSNSMRREFVLQEFQWLQFDSLDLSTHPLNNFTFSYSEMTVLSDLGLIKVGASIVCATSNGYIEVLDGDINKVESFLNGNTNIVNDPNVVDGLNKASNGCKKWKGEIKNWYYNNYNNLVIAALHFKKWPWLAKGTGEMVSYKRRNFSNGWRKHWQMLAIQTQNNFFDATTCDGYTAQAYIYVPASRGRNIALKHRVWGVSQQHRAKNGLTMFGYFYFNNSISHYFFLTW